MKEAIQVAINVAINVAIRYGHQRTFEGEMLDAQSEVISAIRGHQRNQRSSAQSEVISAPSKARC